MATDRKTDSVEWEAGEGASAEANFDSAPPFQPCVRKPQAANVQLLRDPPWVKKGCAQAARSGDPGIAFGRRAAAAVRGAEIRGSLFFSPSAREGRRRSCPHPPTLNRPPTLLTLKPRRAAASPRLHLKQSPVAFFPLSSSIIIIKKTQPSSSSSSNVRFLFAPPFPHPSSL